MTEIQLSELVSKGESDTLEFKKSTAERDAAMKTLCGMLNGSGGRVLVGVTEAGKLRGQTVSDATLKDLAQAYMQFEPPADLLQERVVLANGSEVFVLSVDPSPSAPHTFHGRVYRRLNSTTSVMPQAEYQRRLLEREHPANRWENRPAGVVFPSIWMKSLAPSAMRKQPVDWRRRSRTRNEPWKGSS